MFQNVGSVPDLKQRYKHKPVASNARESLLATVRTSVLEVAAHRNSAEYETEKTTIKLQNDTREQQRGKKKSGKTAGFSILEEDKPMTREDRRKARDKLKDCETEARGALKDNNDKKVPASSGGKKRKGGRSDRSSGKKKSNVAAASSYGIGDEDLMPAPPVYYAPSHGIGVDGMLLPPPQVVPQQKSEQKSEQNADV